MRVSDHEDASTSRAVGWVDDDLDARVDGWAADRAGPTLLGALTPRSGSASATWRPWRHGPGHYIRARQERLGLVSDLDRTGARSVT